MLDVAWFGAPVAAAACLVPHLLPKTQDREALVVLAWLTHPAACLECRFHVGTLWTLGVAPLLLLSDLPSLDLATRAERLAAALLVAGWAFGAQVAMLEVAAV